MFLMCLSSVVAFSQSLKKKKNTGTFFQELYTVDKSTKEKHGSYLKIGKKTQDTLAYGTYDQGKKSGVWSFRGRNNSQYMEYDFDQKKLINFYGTSHNKDSVKVTVGGVKKMAIVDHPAMYIGFKDEMGRVIKYHIKPPVSFFDKGASGMVLSSFEINESGEAMNYTIESCYDLQLIEPIKSAIAEFKTGWMPASLNGTPVASKMYLIINFDFVAEYDSEAKSQFDERADLIVVDMIYMSQPR